MKKLTSIILVLFIGLLAGCAVPSSQVGFALIISTTEPLVATTSEPADKLGKACASNVLGIVASGDSSIEQAKRNGGITKVASVDVDTTSILGLYASKCTVVKGS